jgi:hypothetical protein
MPLFMDSGQRPEESYFTDPDEAAFLADSGLTLTIDDFLTDPPLEQGYDQEQEGGEGGEGGELAEGFEDINTAIYIVGGVGALALLYLLIRG